MTDIDFCLSSYMAYRYTFKDGVDYVEGMCHENYPAIPEDKKVAVSTAREIDEKIQRDFDRLNGMYEKMGILLSGGMDSAVLASYMKPGSIAYTFVSEETKIFDADIERSKEYAEKYGLKQVLVDITFEDYKEFTPIVMREKCGPVHSIEPQIYKAAKQAQADGVQLMIIGDGADYVFGGMDKLLSKDWKFDEFVQRYISLDPELVLTHPVDVYEPFEKYRMGKDGIDFLGFMDDLCTNESYSSYYNAFKASGLPYFDPYENLVMAEPKDLQRIRGGESKYLVRDLYRMKYPEREVPTKIPMPRPVDMIFKDWEGPKRNEFRHDIPMSQLTGNQKWQLWCAELFLNLFVDKQ